MSTLGKNFVGAKYCVVCRKLFPLSDSRQRCPTDDAELAVARQSPFTKLAVGDSFEVSELIGVGGWALVYKARQKALNRLVAVKVLHGYLLARPDTAERFTRESEIVSQLNHPNIVGTVDYGVLADGVPYLIMDFVPGTSLDEFIRYNRRLSPTDTVVIARQIAGALIAAHDLGIIHRDVKPSNVRIVNVGNQDMTAKLMDFGLAKVVSDDAVSNARITMTGYTIGTPAYMSPEMCKGESVDARSDIYSLGCMMYEMLSGQVPFRGVNGFDTMQKQLLQTAERFESYGVDVPSSLQDVVFRAMEKERAARFSSMREFLQVMERAMPAAGGATAASSMLPMQSSPADDEVMPASTSATRVIIVDANKADRELAMVQLQVLGISSDVMNSLREAQIAIAAGIHAAAFISRSAAADAVAWAEFGKRNLSADVPVPLIGILEMNDAPDAGKAFDAVVRKPLSAPQLRAAIKQSRTRNAANAEEETLSFLVDDEATISPQELFEETVTLPPDNDSPVNMEALERTYGLATAIDLLTAFGLTAGRLYQLIGDAAEQQRSTALNLLAHQLKGASDAIGATEISRLSGALQRAAARSDNLQVRIILEGLKFSIAKFATFIKRLRPFTEL